MTGGGGIAGVAVMVSCGFAAWMVVEMAFLLHRRRMEERDAAICSRCDVDVTRDLLTAISDVDGTHRFDAFNRASSVDRLRAARHLIQLVRGADRERLFQIAEHAGLFAPAFDLLSSGVPVRRIEGVRELEQFAGRTCIEGLQRCLSTDTTHDVRLEAAAALARLGELPELPSLIVALDLEHAPLTRMHAAVFRSVAARDCDALLALTFDETRLRVRPMLVEALGWTESFSVLDALAQHGCDTDPEVRCAALRSARRIGHPASSPWIMPCLSDGSEQVRIQAIQACGSLGLVETMPVLRDMAQNPSWWVRTRAAEALLMLDAVKLPFAYPVGLAA